MLLLLTWNLGLHAALPGMVVHLDSLLVRSVILGRRASRRSLSLHEFLGRFVDLRVVIGGCLWKCILCTGWLLESLGILAILLLLLQLMLHCSLQMESMLLPLAIGSLLRSQRM